MSLGVLFLCYSIFALPKTSSNIISYKTENPTINLELNGKQYIFLLDTGSTKTLISNEAAYELGGEKIEVIEKNDILLQKELLLHVNDFLEKIDLNIDKNADITDKKVTVHGILNVSGLEIGGVKIKNISFLYSNDFDQNLLKKMNLDGIIGMDVLENFNSLKIDYTKKIIEFNGTYPNKKKGIKMFHQEQNISGLNISDNLFFISGELNSQNYDFLIDTGHTGPFAIITPSNQIEEDAVKELSSLEQNFLISTLFSGSLKIGSKNLGKIQYCYSSSPTIKWIYLKNEKQENLLGNYIFQNHTIQLDFKNMMFYIE